MRILAVTNMYPTPSKPGLGTFLEEQVRGLRGIGIDVEVLFVDRAQEGVGAYLRVPRLIRSRIKKFGPDLVHVMYGGVMADIVTRTVSDTPVVVTFHGADILGEPSVGPWRKLVATYGVRSSFAAARRAAGAVVVARALQDALPEDVDRSKIRIIPCGIDLARFRPLDPSICRRQINWPGDHFKVLFNSNGDDPVKQPALAYAAVEALNRLGIRSELRELRGLPNSVVPDWLNASDVLLLTSLQEGSPTIVKEALACNVPVVSVDAGDVRELVDGIEGCHIAPADPEALAAKLRQVHAGPSRVEARFRMEELSVGRVASRLKGFYEELLERASADRRISTAVATPAGSHDRHSPVGVNLRSRGSSALRLAVFTNQFPGQTSTFFARDMRALLNAGIDLEIFAFYPLDSQLWRYVPEILSERQLARSKVHHIGLGKSLRQLNPRSLHQSLGFIQETAAISASAVRFGIMPLLKTMYGFPKAWAWALRTDNDFDHVLSYWGNYAATNAYLFHRLVGRRIPFSMFLHAGMDLYQQPVFMRRKLLYADNIIVVCDYNRRFLEKHYSDIFPRISHKIHKYHLGLDLADLQYKPENRARHKVLAVGYFAKYKGFDYLLRSARVLHERGVAFTIELIGDGDEERSLRKLAAELGIQDKVHFHGRLPFDRVQCAMSEATVLVHPSNGIGDAVPTVIKEAMGVGLPVIASDLVGIPELLDHGRCGRLVPPKDVQGLAAAIEELLTDSALRRRYAHEGRKYAEQTFDLWKNGGHLADILRATTRQ